MAKNSAAPLLIVGGAALLLMSGKKKSSSSSKPPAGPSYGPGAEDPMAPAVYPGAGSTPGPTPGSTPSKPPPSNDEDAWLERTEELNTLGYDETDVVEKPDAGTAKAIELFQGDWNWFVDYLNQINPTIEYKAPYTKTGVDGKWGPATEARVDKAIGKFDGFKSPYVEELGREVATFREMINGLKAL
jgi:hypothetical protein